MRLVGKGTRLLLFVVILDLSLGIPFGFLGELSGGRAFAANGETELLRKARALQASGKLQEAYELLQGAVKGESVGPAENETRALYLFALGDLAFRLDKTSDARTYFQQTLESGTRLDDYAKFQIGRAAMRLEDLPGARKSFEAVLDSKAPQSLAFQARRELADIAVRQKNLLLARVHLTYLQRRRKFTQDYPEILFKLLQVDRSLRNSAAVCRWARELYTKYPSHPLVTDWSMDLSKAKVNGDTIGCSVNVKDKQTRIKRLQWAGEAARALNELETLKKEASWLGEYTFDTLMSNHLLNEGAVDDALKLLIKHYDTHSGDPGYLLQLGKTASRAGEYQVAVGAYYKAYKIAPRGRSGKTALFQAAFMSYQFQDYDGATRKFEEFVQAFPRSGLSRDSNWHMAWIRYLKGDYPGAYSSFAKLTVATTRVIKKRRGRRRIQMIEPVQAERSRYWMAMSLLKLGKRDEAKPLFQTLARDPGIGYYSVVAWYRLQALGAKENPKPDNRSPATTPESGPVVEPVTAVPADAMAVALNEEEESEETLTPGAEGGDDAVAEGAGDEPGAAVAGEVVEGTIEEKKLSAQFDDPYLAKRFERARDLVAVGRIDLARQELVEIERHARRPDDRRKLMGEYQAVDNFNRPSYISETGFGAERLRDGMVAGRPLWEFAYPRAFEKAVLANARSFAVAPELVWGIMRAESQYRQEAQSPVGALGLMQLMPFTGRKVAELLSINGFETPSLLEPETNIRLGSRYLQRLHEKFSGSVPLIAAGYNAGPHRVQSWLKSFGLLDMDEFIEHVPFIETRNYVKKVVRNYQIYHLLYNGSGSRGGRTLAWLVKPVGVKPTEASRDVW